MANEAADAQAFPMRGVPQPTREQTLDLPQVHISRHPVIAHKMTLLRDKRTAPPAFYRIVRELGALLAYESTADLKLEPVRIETPIEPMTGSELAGGVGIVPILRAGLGLAEGFREVLPDAAVWHLGLRRDERTLEPIEYYNQLARSNNLQVCFSVDPMLATGGSAIDALNILKRYGVPHLRYVALIGAPYGLLKLRQAHPDVPIYLAALDERLNDRGFICPGLGDAGDRQFGTL
ncbi:MAG TPA: uracil phosphoribosyltransferase [Ktedonobacterales bacterium]|jgi:uracil phosphoribosyltransferase|nr:uracil phosphoribosyltransferase [Ktedonobacterales bacterium]